MSDLETRLTEALRGGSESAPDAVGLADAARSRARAHRRMQMASVGAVAVAALAIPLAVLALGDDDNRGKAPVADNTTAPDPEPVENGRWESWHGVTVRVPEDWEHGNQSAWCADGGSVETFRVTRPGGPVPMIACTPASSYGLSFQEIEMDETDEPFDWPVVTQTGDAWPPDTYVGAHGENGVLVTVAGPDREDLLAVLDTIRTVDDVDPNGCGATSAAEPQPPTGTMSVCRYTAAGDLEQSELLTGDDVSEATAALRGTPDAADCRGAEFDEPYVLMWSDEVTARVDLGGPCPVVGGMDRPRALTKDVVFWALSPGWTGAVDGHVPMPDELRAQ